MFLLAKLCIQHAGVYCLFSFYSTKKKNNPKEYFPLQGHSSWLYNRNVSPCAPRSVKPTTLLLLQLLYNTYQCFLAELLEGLERTNMVSLRCGGVKYSLETSRIFRKNTKETPEYYICLHATCENKNLLAIFGVKR